MFDKQRNSCFVQIFSYETKYITSIIKCYNSFTSSHETRGRRKLRYRIIARESRVFQIEYLKKKNQKIK